MPSILNCFPQGKRIFLCSLLLFPILVLATPLISDETIDPACKSTWDSLAGLVRQKDTLLKLQIAAIKDSLKMAVDSAKTSEVTSIFSLQELSLERQEVICSTEVNTLTRLEGSNIIYGVILDTNPQKKITETYLATTGPRMIVFRVVGAATFVHETTHGKQFEDLSIAYRKDNGTAFGDDVEDEVEAYKTEFAFYPDSVAQLKSCWNARMPADMTVKWVRHLHNPGSKDRLYSREGSAKIAQIPISMTSTRSQILRAYKCYKDRKTRWKEKYTPMADRNLYYKTLKPRMGA